MSLAERSRFINETDTKGRTALHYLCYENALDMVQLLASTNLLRLHLVDTFDRNCMHYAAIRGGSKLLNCLFMLYK